jgi:hypothetical protein
MSLMNRDRYRKKLRELLSLANDENFLRMVWAIDALQSERVTAASRCIRFPTEATASDLTSKFKIHKWELETLVGQLLTTPKSIARDGRNRILNCTEFGTGATVVDHLRKLENADYGIFRNRFGILQEMHRAGQRQFPWQRGHLARIMHDG